MSDDRLDVYLSQRYAGQFARDRSRSVSFVYDEAYADALETTPLSLSMPKSQLVHDSGVAGSWIANLLPESEKKLERIAAQVGMRSIEPFDLLAKIGHDVAGAVQILPEGAAPEDLTDIVERYETDIADEIRGLRSDPDHLPDQYGRWSLAGQQGKIALARHQGRWYTPTGTAASTHILKIGPAGIEHGDLAEYVTLRAAHYCLIPTPHASLEHFEDQLAVVVERYDRRFGGASAEGVPDVRRIHQEDMCQVLGLRPGLKYQADGGPSAREIADALWRLPARDRELSVQSFARLLTFNALAYSPDAHAKNYSVLLEPAGATFAPAYDLMSNAIRLNLRDVRHNTQLSMKTGSSRYEADRVDPQRLHAFGAELGLPGEWMVETARELALRMGIAFDLALDDAQDAIGANETIDSWRRHAAALDRLLVERWA